MTRVESRQIKTQEKKQYVHCTHYNAAGPRYVTKKILFLFTTEQLNVRYEKKKKLA